MIAHYCAGNYAVDAFVDAFWDVAISVLSVVLELQSKVLETIDFFISTHAQVHLYPTTKLEQFYFPNVFSLSGNYMHKKTYKKCTNMG